MDRPFFQEERDLLKKKKAGGSSEDQDENDNFEDAVEEQTISVCEMDLESGIADTQVALNLFLNNRFEEAKKKMKPGAKESIYHSLGYATVLYIKAMMTCDPQDIELAVTESKSACNVCSRFRRQTTLTSHVTSQVNKLVKIGPKQVLTDLEMHAELCYAECLLQRALLTFIQDENLVSFVKGAMKIRTCYQSYRECQRLLHQSEGEGPSASHFESGVRMGIGTFNLMISVLPNRILRLMEFIGFSGNKELGLQQLQTGAEMAGSLRSSLCALVLLCWHLIAAQLFSSGDGDIQLCQKLLTPLLHNFPKGALVLYLAGRLLVVTAQLPQAVEYLLRSVGVQSEWRQFHHLCFWELMFAHAYQRQWSQATSHAQRLYKENRWSRCTYGYMAAVYLWAQHPQNLTWDERNLMEQLFRTVPSLKQRIAGKSLPIEKFCSVKAQMFTRNKTLTLPHYELIYLWNGFQILGLKAELIQPVLEDVEKTLDRLNKLDAPMDDRGLCLMLKAMCLKHLQSPFQAEQCLQEILREQKSLGENLYLAPNSWFELGLMKLAEERYDEAKDCVRKAKDYKGYLLESRLHFRIHNLSDRLGGYSPETPL